MRRKDKWELWLDEIWRRAKEISDAWDEETREKRRVGGGPWTPPECSTEFIRELIEGKHEASDDLDFYIDPDLLDE